MAEDSTVGTPAESPLAPAILRGLGDRSYDKRKNAALEIEALIKTLEDNNETDRICSIIVLLGQDFATSTNPNHRKGGLIGLAASSIGLMSVGAFPFSTLIIAYAASNMSSVVRVVVQHFVFFTLPVRWCAEHFDSQKKREMPVACIPHHRPHCDPRF